MTDKLLLSVLALLAFGAPAMAQDLGGVRLAPGTNGGPVGLARPLPFTFPPMLTAQEAQNGMSAADHQSKNQAMISRLRGDPGFLSGFNFGNPLAASRQVQSAQAGPDDAGYGYRRRHHGHGPGPIIINNEGPLAVTVGNGNVVQQQNANGSGPIGQQQVATTPSAGSRTGGAVNLVGDGNIIQRAPGGR